MSEPKLSPAELAKHVGNELGVSSWMTIDQARINEFAHCTGDHQWIHVDVERARRERPDVGTVAHGYLTLALLAPTSFEILMSRVSVKEALNYGLDKVRFPTFVRSGARVRNHIRLLSVEDRGKGRYLVTTENTFEIENEARPGVVAIALVLLAD
jgi:acyl dehydratase